MICPYCTEGQIIPDRDAVVNHLIVTEDKLGHIHIHGPIAEPDKMQRLMDAIKREGVRSKYGDEAIQTD